MGSVRQLSVPPQVVINADDFGLHEAINEGIVRSHRQGVVTSTSLVACGTAFQDAIALSKECPLLGIGVHLTLVEERPILPKDEVQSLMDDEGAMPKNYAAFAHRWLIGTIREEDVMRELEAQICRVLAAGIIPSHLDSHQHIHCLPGMWKIAMRLAKKYRVPYLRLPQFDSVSADATIAESVLRVGVNALSFVRHRRGSPGVHHADSVRGFAHSGRMTPARLLSILRSLESGLTEVMVHPKVGSPDLKERYRRWPRVDWDSDLQALMDIEVVQLCRSGSVNLTNFAHVSSQ